VVRIDPSSNNDGINVPLHNHCPELLARL
jgi:hypothetical protein